MNSICMFLVTIVLYSTLQLNKIDIFVIKECNWTQLHAFATPRRHVQVRVLSGSSAAVSFPGASLRRRPGLEGPFK